MKMKGEKQKSFKFLLYPGALLLRRPIAMSTPAYSCTLAPG